MPGYGGFGGTSRREQQIRQIVSPRRPSKPATHSTKDTKKMAGENRKKQDERREPTRISAQDVQAAAIPPAMTPQPGVPGSAFGSVSGAGGAFGGGAQGGGAPGFGLTGDVPLGGNQWTGFAGQYSPVGSDVLFGQQGNNILSRDILAALGYDNPNAGYLPLMEDYISNAPWLGMIAAGGQIPTTEALINYMGGFGQQGLGAGGVGVDSAAMLAALQQQLADPSSPIAQMFVGASPEEQQNLLATFLAAATQGVNPYQQSIYFNQLDQGLNDYQRGLAHGDMQAGGTPFLDYYLQSNPRGLGG